MSKKIRWLIFLFTFLFLISAGWFFSSFKHNQNTEKDYELLRGKKVEQVLVSRKWCSIEKENAPVTETYEFLPDGTFTRNFFDIDIDSSETGKWSVEPYRGSGVLFLANDKAIYFEIDSNENLYLYSGGSFAGCKSEVLPTDLNIVLAEGVVSDVQAPELWRVTVDTVWQKVSDSGLATYPSKISFISNSRYRFDYSDPTGSCGVLGRYSIFDNRLYREVPKDTTCGGNDKIKLNIINNSLSFENGILKLENSDYSLVE